MRHVWKVFIWLCKATFCFGFGIHYTILQGAEPDWYFYINIYTLGTLWPTPQPDVKLSKKSNYTSLSNPTTCHVNWCQHMNVPSPLMSFLFLCCCYFSKVTVVQHSAPTSVCSIKFTSSHYCLADIQRNATQQRRKPTTIQLSSIKCTVIQTHRRKMFTTASAECRFKVEV